jgi:hypothetical protein
MMDIDREDDNQRAEADLGNRTDMEQTTLSRQTIEEMIEGIDWYQKIPLGADLYTPGEATAHKAVREKFEIVKSILNSNVEFMNLNVLDLDPGKIGEFDVVLFLAVFHHLRYPFLALDKIAAITRGVLILETPVAVPSGGDPATEDDPIMLRRYSSKHTTKLRHLPNVPFLLEILQRAGFAKVDVLGYHRRKKVLGYDGRYIERRVILKAYKDA